jgi:hypothetical protein
LLRKAAELHARNPPPPEPREPRQCRSCRSLQGQAQAPRTTRIVTVIHVERCKGTKHASLCLDSSISPHTMRPHGDECAWMLLTRTPVYPPLQAQIQPLPTCVRDIANKPRSGTAATSQKHQSVHVCTCVPHYIGRAEALRAYGNNVIQGNTCKPAAQSNAELQSRQASIGATQLVRAQTREDSTRVSTHQPSPFPIPTIHQEVPTNVCWPEQRPSTPMCAWATRHMRMPRLTVAPPKDPKTVSVQNGYKGTEECTTGDRWKKVLQKNGSPTSPRTLSREDRECGGQQLHTHD